MYGGFCFCCLQPIFMVAERCQPLSAYSSRIPQASKVFLLLLVCFCLKILYITQNPTKWNNENRSDRMTRPKRSKKPPLSPVTSWCARPVGDFAPKPDKWVCVVGLHPCRSIHGISATQTPQSALSSTTAVLQEGSTQRMKQWDRMGVMQDLLAPILHNLVVIAVIINSNKDLNCSKLYSHFPSLKLYRPVKGISRKAIPWDIFRQ